MIGIETGFSTPSVRLQADDHPPNDEPEDPLLAEPDITEADMASTAAAIAYFKRINRNWSAPMEADLLDKLDVQPDGSVRINTPPAVLKAMSDAAHAFSPDYKPLRAPALVLTTLPGEWRDMFPWLAANADARTEKAASDADFFIEREGDVMRLVDGMSWL